ncbi:alanine--tRNA ligase [Bryobacterales bacterium F-183]|nr:alanine--tRNA ligase [Bryobacterales bacterium F-183]
MTGHETRQKFLDYFAQHGHRIVKSSSLVPANDPTLLFTNAGMNQFKDLFLGAEKRDYSRATTSQKCVRAGGKHNDLENVGYTRRHHTFFEMLGNFSFGDYFKREAIDFAWTLITKDYGLPKDKLYVTVFREDDDAENLWQEVTGIPKSRIFRLDEKDNFWQMGDTGPCGPCSEIHYDLGPEAAAPGREHEVFPDDAGGRFVEIWNLVFMQFDRDSSGTLTPLPRPSIDTGMGLERIAAVMQGKMSNYDTDLIKPICEKAGEIFKVAYGAAADTDTAMRINADHARATAFLINDGVVPSNEGRGYVLRKIMRRAMRHGRRAGMNGPYLHELTKFVAEFMSGAYPDMLDSISRVSRIVKDEENRYATTFQVAEKIFNDEAKKATGGVLPGSASFKLYDTYGLALDEQEDMAREFGLTIDNAAFREEMEKQRTRARASWKGADKTNVPEIYKSLPSSEFIGRETLESPARVAKVIEIDGRTEVVLDRSPFYAEAGGQVGDIGVLLNANGDVLAQVEGTYKPAPGTHVQKVALKGDIKEGDLVIARVEAPSRQSIMRNHTGTHLLHAALRTVLGPHVKQAGSIVDPGRLRFDFAHYAQLSPEELQEVERLMNVHILKNITVNTDVMDLDQALSTGAMALFGEKYGEKVRVVGIGDFSKELCGGTHVCSTGEIGLCKIVYEGSISAGVRRIEAVSGEGSLKRFQDTQANIARLAQLTKSSESDLIENFEKLLSQQRTLERQIEQMKEKIAHSQAANLESQARKKGDVHILAAQLDGLDRAQLRTLADSLRNKWKSAVVLLAAAEGDGAVSIVAAVTKDLSGKVHAGKLAGAVAQAIGGKGGGRPDMAEAGGKDAAALPGALEQAYASVEGMLQ